MALKGEARPTHGPKGRQGIRSLEAYCGLFQGVWREKALGEASVIYLRSPEAPLRTKRHLSDVGQVAILRAPVDRAYSNEPTPITCGTFKRAAKP